VKRRWAILRLDLLVELEAAPYRVILRDELAAEGAVLRCTVAWREGRSVVDGYADDLLWGFPSKYRRHFGRGIEEVDVLAVILSAFHYTAISQVKALY
jgi:hypothetical protein